MSSAYHEWIKDSKFMRSHLYVHILLIFCLLFIPSHASLVQLLSNSCCLVLPPFSACFTLICPSFVPLLMIYLDNWIAPFQWYSPGPPLIVLKQSEPVHRQINKSTFSGSNFHVSLFLCFVLFHGLLLSFVLHQNWS